MLRFVGVVWEGNPWGTEAIRLLRAMFMVDKREGGRGCVDYLTTQAPKSVLTQLTKIVLKPKTNVNVKNSVKNTDGVDKIRYIHTIQKPLKSKPLLIAII